MSYCNSNTAEKLESFDEEISSQEILTKEEQEFEELLRRYINGIKNYALMEK